MEHKDYYKILGVSEDSSADEIKKAYKRLAVRYHPDKNLKNKKEAEEKFKLISEAYYVLSDAGRKEEYDTFRKGGFRGAYTGASGFSFDDLLKQFGMAGASGTSQRRGGGKYSEFGDILGALFGGHDFNERNFVHVRGSGNEYRPPSRGSSDINAVLQIPRASAGHHGKTVVKVHGKKITVTIPPGMKSGQKLRLKGQGELCPYCNHRGDLILMVKIV